MDLTILYILVILASAGITLLALRLTRPVAPERCADCGGPAWNRWSDGRAVCAACAERLMEGTTRKG